MRRTIFCGALVFTLMTAWAVAQETDGAKKAAKPQKQAPTAQAVRTEKLPKKTTPSDIKLSKKVVSKAQEKAQEVESTEPVQPKLDKDGLYQIEKNIVEFTNRERVRRGLKPLQIDKQLVDSARGQTKWMTKTRRLQHTKKPVGENIAMGYRTSKDVVRGWMNSSGHRANILNSGYRRIGVAAYKAKDGTVWWCQQFLR